MTAFDHSFNGAEPCQVNHTPMLAQNHTEDGELLPLLVARLHQALWLNSFELLMTRLHRPSWAAGTSSPYGPQD